MLGQLKSMLDHNGASLRIVCFGGSNVIVVDDKFLDAIKQDCAIVDGANVLDEPPVSSGFQQLRITAGKQASGATKAFWFAFGCVFGAVLTIAIQAFLS